MTLTIGRYGITINEERGPTQVRWSGDRLTIDGWMQAATLAEVKAARQQLNGYINNLDEQIVPAAWDLDPDIDGSYRVAAVSIDLLPAGSSYQHKIFKFDTTIERLSAGHSIGKIEELHLGALRTNAHSITTSNTRPFVAIPTAALGLTGIDKGDMEEEQLASETGAVRYMDHGTSADRNLFFDLGRLSYRLAPADWYDGAATILIEDQVVVGRQARNVPDDWELSNGHCRVKPGPSGVLTVGVWNGSAWEEIDFNLRRGIASGNLTADPYAISVNRNSPECCSVKLHYETTVSSEQASWTVDLTLRRGQRFIEGYLYAPDYGTTWGIGRSATEAGTAITGGIRATSNDANGNRYLLSSPATHTTDTTNGRLGRTVGSEVFPFMFAVELNGSSSTGMGTAQNLVYAYHSPVNTHMQAVTP